MSDPFKGSLDDLYRAPQSDISTPLGLPPETIHFDDDSEALVRTAQLPAESTVRTIGLIYLLTGLFFVISISVVLVVPRFAETIDQKADGAKISPSLLRWAMFGLGIAGCLLYAGLGAALRDLRNWARWTLIVLIVLALLNRLGSLLSPTMREQLFAPNLASVVALTYSGLQVFMLILLLVPASAVVCSRHYRFIRSETRHIQARLGFRDWMLLDVFVLNAALGLVSQFL